MERERDPRLCDAFMFCLSSHVFSLLHFLLSLAIPLKIKKHVLCVMQSPLKSCLHFFCCLFHLNKFACLFTCIGLYEINCEGFDLSQPLVCKLRVNARI